MTREDIIRMAREATDEYAKENAWRKNFWRFSQEELQRFAALVAAHREAQSIHSCGPDCQKPMCVNRRREIAAAVEAELEQLRGQRAGCRYPACLDGGGRCHAMFKGECAGPKGTQP